MFIDLSLRLSVVCVNDNSINCNSYTFYVRIIDNFTGTTEMGSFYENINTTICTSSD